MSDLDHPFWTDPLHDEREAQRDAAYNEPPEVDDAPSPAECEDHPTHGIEDDPYCGICGGCHQPVSAFAGDPGGHEGSCLWTGGPWHPSCREADPERAAILAQRFGS